MTSTDTLATRLERTAAKAEKVGLDDIAGTCREAARTYRELRDDLKKIGEGD